LDAGGLKFSSNGELLNPTGSIKPNTEEWYKIISGNEIEAYKMQYSYDSSFPGNTGGNGLKGINIHSVGNIWNPSTRTYVYNPIKNYSNWLKLKK
jgi:hypothetical protein